MNRITPESRRAGATWRRYREALGLTQEDLARACNNKPNRSYIQQVEQGRLWVPSPEYFNNVVRVLGMPGWEYFEALGYDTGAVIDGVEAGVLVSLSKLSPDQQRALVPQMKVMAKYSGGDDN